MKKTTFIFVMILFMITNIFSAENILLKYYNLFSDSSKTSFPKIKKTSDNKWISEDGPSDDAPYGWTLNVFDEKNYYLELELDGDIETVRYTMAVYLSQDKNNVFAVSEINIRESGEKESHFSFYRFNEKPMKDVTGLILPEIKRGKFFKKNYDFSALDNINKYLTENSGREKNIAVITCSIPREGTLTKFSFELISPSYNYDEKVKKIIDDARKSIVKKNIAFGWNYKKGIFEEK